MLRDGFGHCRHSSPIVDAASLDKTVFVPVHVLERGRDADLEDGPRGIFDAGRWLGG